MMTVMLLVQEKMALPLRLRMTATTTTTTLTGDADATVTSFYLALFRAVSIRNPTPVRYTDVWSTRRISRRRSPPEPQILKTCRPYRGFQHHLHAWRRCRLWSSGLGLLFRAGHSLPFWLRLVGGGATPSPKLYEVAGYDPTVTDPTVIVYRV